MILLYIQEYEDCVLSMVCASFIPTSTERDVNRSARVFVMYVCICMYVCMCVCVFVYMMFQYIRDSRTMSWENLAVRFAASEVRCSFMCKCTFQFDIFEFKYKANLKSVTVCLMAGLMNLF